jgi:hypothetical protein
VSFDVRAADATAAGAAVAAVACIISHLEKVPATTGTSTYAAFLPLGFEYTSSFIDYQSRKFRGRGGSPCPSFFASF